MKEQAIQKMNKMGKVGCGIILAGKIIVIAVIILTLILTIAIAFVPKNLITFKAGGNGQLQVDLSAIGQSLSEEDMEQINSGDLLKNINMDISVEGNQFQFDEVSTKGDVVIFQASGDIGNTINLHHLIPALVIAMISMTMTVISLFFAGFVCKAFKTCESPFEENVIQKMRQFAFSLIPWVVLKSINESMFSSILNGRSSINISIDFTMLIIVLVVLALVYIFKYGAILQQESDETL